MNTLSIFVGTVYGNAQHVAEDVSSTLQTKNISSEIFTDPKMSDFTKASNILFITSTTGQGDIPPNLEFFIEDLRKAAPSLDNKPFAVAALGDSSYGESFCGAGVQIFELLIELKGKAVTDLLEVDACETLEPEVEVVAWVEKHVERLCE
jgi:flavodoxin